MTSLVYVGIALLLAWALVRRPQLITIGLCLAFGLAVLAADIAEGEHLRSILMGMDALVVIGMWFLWSMYRSERAALVATLGFLKIWLGIAAASFTIDYSLWAGGNNAIFVLQVFIAGGFADGFIAWVGRCHLSFRNRRNGLLGYLEKIR